MKIISRGAIKPKQVTVSCDKCQSVLLVDETDGEKNYDQRDGNFIAVLCPVCSTAINIDYKLFH